MLCAIALDPHLAIDDINVDKTAMNTFTAIPTHIHQHIAVILSIKDRFRLNVAIGVWDRTACLE